MEQMPYPYRVEPRHPTGDDRDPRAIAAPAISTVVTLAGGFVLGYLAVLTLALCGNACHNDPAEAVIVTVCGWGLVIPVVLLLISWLLPWRRRHAATRLAFAILAPFSLGALRVLFNVWLALT
ncbi:hypothetical protein ACH4UR_18345 [Streptomyces lydicus]|uniref:hypothetical protein n=1 Tax=Streptomyces lydicus TaxID=47763 RepID=UPI0037A9FDEA